MAKMLSLADLVDALDIQAEEASSFYNRNTGEIYVVTDEEIRGAEEDIPLEEYPEWQREMIVHARELLANEDSFIPLPDKFEIHEWSMMDRFARGIETPEICDQLCSSLRGKGAYRNFKDTIQRFGLSDRWYSYRSARLEQIAREWCKENGVEFEAGKHHSADRSCRG